MRQLLCIALLGCAGCVLYTPGCEHAQPYDMGIYEPADLFRGIGATCTTSCNEGLCCSGICVDVTSDPHNCGACGIACASGECVAVDGGGGSFCSCDADGGTPGCAAPTEPQCDSRGLCVCGGSSGQCAPPRASGCSAAGECMCGNEPECGFGADHCDPSQSPSCRCGNDPACDTTIADHCNPNQSPSCGCGSGPACQKGAASCCTWSHTCCPDSKYCCLDGCCDHPCLLLGFCG